MKLATLPANFKARLQTTLHITFRMHFVQTLPIVSKCEISYYGYTFVVRKFQNFHDVNLIENTAKMENYFHCMFIHTYAYCIYIVNFFEDG